MRTVLCACLPVFALAAQQSETRRAFVELVTAKSEYWEKELAKITVRVGIDTAFFRERAIPLLRRGTDLPVHVATRTPSGPSIVGLPAKAHAPGTPTLTLACDDAIVAARRVADRVLDGRSFTVVEIDKTIQSRVAGKLLLPAPSLAFAHTTRFVDDFLNGRTAVDRRDETVTTEPSTLTFLPLPEAGRPREFSGAVGRFTLTARFSPSSLGVGEIGRLVLEIAGDGSLASVQAPRLEALRGFHVYGRLEEGGETARIYTYEIAPLREVIRAVPSIQFAFFDPSPPAGYRVLQTEPIAISVRPLPAGRRLDLPAEALAAGPVPGVDEIFDLWPVPTGSEADPARALSLPYGFVALALPWVLALGFGALARSRRRASTPSRRAFATLLENHARPDANHAELLAEFLAAHLGCKPAAMIAPNLAKLLVARGIDAQLASRTERELELLVAQRYAKTATAVENRDIRDLARALAAALGRREGAA